MTPSNTIEELVGLLDWVPHVHREGSREHVIMWGIMESPDGAALPVTWCSHPFCDGNQTMVEWLLSKGVDPVDAQPPPKLREALSRIKGDHNDEA